MRGTSEAQVVAGFDVRLNPFISKESPQGR